MADLPRKFKVEPRRLTSFLHQALECPGPTEYMDHWHYHCYFNDFQPWDQFLAILKKKMRLWRGRHIWVESDIQDDMVSIVFDYTYFGCYRRMIAYKEEVEEFGYFHVYAIKD
jgi:hypothetical protein